ncbi:hypothetical protein BD413DRAFT_553043 [Trametes elegans]|nr:hypothetical protein BD413DRAFT_553043 [Trametes elegans]
MASPTAAGSPGAAPIADDVLKFLDDLSRGTVPGSASSSEPWDEAAWAQWLNGQDFSLAGLGANTTGQDATTTGPSSRTLTPSEELAVMQLLNGQDVDRAGPSPSPFDEIIRDFLQQTSAEGANVAGPSTQPSSESLAQPQFPLTQPSGLLAQDPIPPVQLPDVPVLPPFLFAPPHAQDNPAESRSSELLDKLAHAMTGRDRRAEAEFFEPSFFPRLPPAPALVVGKCDSAEELERLCDLWNSSFLTPVDHLDVLEISLGTFADFGEGMESECESYTTFSRVHLLGDLLLSRAGQGIRRLLLDRLHQCILHDDRIATALSSMRQLESAEFGTVSDDALQKVSLANSGETLHTLRLYYFWAGDETQEEYNDQSKTCTELTKYLRPLTNLHTLEVSDFSPPDPAVNMHVTPIKRLVLRNATQEALRLVDICPGLKHLTVTFVGGEREREPPVDCTFFYRWPPLQRLTVGNPRDQLIFAGRPNGVDWLDIEHPFTHRFCLDYLEEESFMKLLSQTSPAGLSMSLHVGGAPMAFWKDVPAHAPRLQYLALELSLLNTDMECIRWLDVIPEALRPLSIRYLCLTITTTATVQDQLEQDEAVRFQRLRAAHEVEVHRRRALRDLPHRLAGGLPGLCLLTLRIGEENKDNLSGKGHVRTVRDQHMLAFETGVRRVARAERGGLEKSVTYVVERTGGAMGYRLVETDKDSSVPLEEAVADGCAGKIEKAIQTVDRHIFDDVDFRIPSL